MNLSNEVLFLLQGGAGAVSGYITNKYAVNMLFKEYEPFKIFNKVIIICCDNTSQIFLR